MKHTGVLSGGPVTVRDYAFVCLSVCPPSGTTEDKGQSVCVCVCVCNGSYKKTGTSNKAQHNDCLMRVMIT